MKPKLAILLRLCIAAGIYIGNAAYPGLLDDADSSHVTVSRAMLQRGVFLIAANIALGVFRPYLSSRPLVSRRVRL